MNGSQAVRRNRVAAGHQPNFFPWFGYFEKMLKSDVFVFSDDVRYPKETYVNRVQIPIAGEPAYLTLPVRRGDDQQIAVKRYVKDDKVLDRLLKTVRISLGGLPCGRDVEPTLACFAEAFRRFETLAELNIATIQFVASELGIGTPTLRGTELGLATFHRNERLIERCRALGAGTYLSGRGAGGYQDDAALASAGIAVRMVTYDLGDALLGADLRYSILVGIAKLGLGRLRAAIAGYVPA